MCIIIVGAGDIGTPLTELATTPATRSSSSSATMAGLMAITAGAALGFLELDAALAEAVFVLNMWVGRLEMGPVLVFLRAAIAGLDP